MNEWSVVLVIISLVGLIGAVMKPLINLNNSITELTAAVKQLQNQMSKNNDDIDEVKGTVQNHETRITILEQK